MTSENGNLPSEVGINGHAESHFISQLALLKSQFASPAHGFCARAVANDGCSLATHLAAIFLFAKNSSFARAVPAPAAVCINRSGCTPLVLRALGGSA